MRRIRKLLVLALAGGLVGTLAPAAWAGGWDSLEPQQDHYLPGQTAVLRGAFAVNRLKGTGRLEDGPYYAYLLAGSSLYGMIDPPRIPNGAIPGGRSVRPGHGGGRRLPVLEWVRDVYCPRRRVGEPRRQLLQRPLPLEHDRVAGVRSHHHRSHGARGPAARRARLTEERVASGAVPPGAQREADRGAGYESKGSRRRPAFPARASEEPDGTTRCDPAGTG